jgi:lysozyme
MKLTREGIALIKRFEGFRANAYRDAVGVWTIGYGHTAMAGPPDVRPGMTIDRAEGSAILARDLEMFAAGVRKDLTRLIGDRQFSALVSFAYNVGLGNFRKSSVLAAVNAGQFEAVPRRLQLWVKAGGRTLPGLVKRRAAEAALFAGEDRSMPAGPVDPIEGKRPMRSTTNLAAVLAALAGALSTVAASLKETADAMGGPLVPVLLLIAMVAATVWIIRERRRKSREEGV